MPNSPKNVLKYNHIGTKSIKKIYGKNLILMQIGPRLSIVAMRRMFAFKVSVYMVYSTLKNRFFVQNVYHCTT